MKKVIVAIAFAHLFFGAVHAQSGNNQISIGPEVGVPIGDFGSANGFKVGFGGFAKYMHGIGEAGQLTLASGYTSFSSKVFTNLSTSIIPVLAGYRHNINGFFVEPQIGISFYRLAAVGSINKAAFTYAAGVGYALEQGLEFGARFQGASVKYNEFAESVSYAFIGFHVAYNFSLSGHQYVTPIRTTPQQRTSRHRY